MLRRVLSIATIVLGAALLILAALLIAPADVVQFAAAVLLPSLAVLQLGLIALSLILIYLAMLIGREGERVRRVSYSVATLAAVAIVTAIGWRDLRHYSRRVVRIEDNGRMFEGTFYSPRQAPRALPAVLILHGSGPMRRRAYHNIADRFARNGVAVLNVDKAGVGGSSGTYYGDDLGRDSVIERRAVDARIALEFLTRQSGVDTARIGVVSLSQGGWIVPLLLQGQTPAQFAINLSGPAVSSSEEGVWSDWTNESEDHFGLKPPPVPFDTLDARLRSVAPGGFDPRPHLRLMNRPSLWLFGEWDSSLPTMASVRVLDSLRNEGIVASVHVFADANHGLMVVRGPNGSRLANFAPGVWDTVFAWLARASKNNTR